MLTYIAVWSKLRYDNLGIGDFTFWALEQKPGWVDAGVYKITL